MTGWNIRVYSIGNDILKFEVTEYFATHQTLFCMSNAPNKPDYKNGVKGLVLMEVAALTGYHLGGSGSLLHKEIVAVTICVVMYFTVKGLISLGISGARVHHNTALSNSLLAAFFIVSIQQILTLFALAYSIFGLQNTHTWEVVHDMSSSLYFSTMTLTTVGYGDYIPVSGAAKITAGIEAIMGYFSFALVAAVMVIRITAIAKAADQNGEGHDT